MKQLYNTHRPETWGDVAGQSRIVKRLRSIEERSGLGGRAYWISGPSGAGKSTLAQLVASSVADDFATDELDATEITPKDIRELERSHACRPIGSMNGWAVIVNEAQGLRKDTIKQLLVTLERIPEHVVWCFTTIDSGDGLFGTDTAGHPLLSRCMDCQLDGGDHVALPFAIRARAIAQEHGLDGRPIEDYVDLVRRHKCNLRAVLVDIETGAMLPGDD